jgi:transcriptional regulator with GAF, ATPase, and Fis domain
VLKTGESIILYSAILDPRFKLQRSVVNAQMASVLCTPIRITDGIAALVHLENSRAGHFTKEHLDLMRGLCEMAGPVLEALIASRSVLKERDQLVVSESRFREEAQASRESQSKDWSFGRFIGRSHAVQQLGRDVGKIASTNFPVLVLGETGTGKSVLARILHYGSPRAKEPLITLFCPSLERGMVEAELFGHKKGAFTGALSDRMGKVQAADGGTLFLDEIGELPLEIQPKLLRLLQERTFERVGDPTEMKADVRVIAATNRDLEQEVAEGRFRRDLFERLNFVPVRIPPLRERVDDIPLVLRHCLDQSEDGRWIELEPEAEEYLKTLDFAWPGNVRVLEQLAARLVLEKPDGPVSRPVVARLLGPTVRRPEPSAVPVAVGGPAGPGVSLDGPDIAEGLPALLAQAEKAWLEEALRRYPKDTRAELAARLKISVANLYKKLKEYGLGG